MFKMDCTVEPGVLVVLVPGVVVPGTVTVVVVAGVVEVPTTVVVVVEPGVVVPGVEVVTGVPGILATVFPDIKPLPKVTCCAASVPVQSTPFDVEGLLEISTSLVSINTCRVGLSSSLISDSNASCSFSVATTTNWLVRSSGNTLLRLSVSEAWIDCTRFDAPAYLI